MNIKDFGRGEGWASLSAETPTPILCAQYELRINNNFQKQRLMPENVTDIQ